MTFAPFILIKINPRLDFGEIFYLDIYGARLFILIHLINFKM